MFDPLLRLKAAVDAFDNRAAEILAFHAAIEGELDLRLAELLAKPHRLRNLGFGQKVSVWASLQPFDDEIVNRVVKVILRFNDLRNAIAHGDSRNQVDTAIQRLIASLPEDAPHRDKMEPKLAAGFIFGALNGASRNATAIKIGRSNS